MYYNKYKIICRINYNMTTILNTFIMINLYQQVLNLIFVNKIQILIKIKNFSTNIKATIHQNPQRIQIYKNKSARIKWAYRNSLIFNTNKNPKI